MVAPYGGCSLTRDGIQPLSLLYGPSSRPATSINRGDGQDQLKLRIKRHLLRVADTLLEQEQQPGGSSESKQGMDINSPSEPLLPPPPGRREERNRRREKIPRGWFTWLGSSFPFPLSLAET
jgi:hypothetical protein